VRKPAAPKVLLITKWDRIDFRDPLMKSSPVERIERAETLLRILCHVTPHVIKEKKRTGKSESFQPQVDILNNKNTIVAYGWPEIQASGLSRLYAMIITSLTSCVIMGLIYGVG